ncbi:MULTISPECIES: hypothetical protein [Vibrio]|uniref:Uncharacterized protein n=1 Tax=Vibrio casei TaxID=673372 RepID=A0A368LJF2_9VIBR|nr:MULTISPECIES: hypothetical protein [Vibrio]RCS70765.1 hypothetical protein CIK83_15235 [Vibrio casei]SJN25269.1 hypothetical protein FM109_06005 [Vibrio casei]HBV76817.1 hypothetical protein [Vibrio sp.]
MFLQKLLTYCINKKVSINMAIMIDAVGMDGLTYNQLCERYSMAFTPKNVAKLCDIIGRNPEHFIRTSKAHILAEKGINWDTRLSKKPPTLICLSETGELIYLDIQKIIKPKNKLEKNTLF